MAVLNVCSYVGAVCPYTDCVCSFALSWESWFDGNASDIFFQDMLTSVTLVEEGLHAEERKLELDVRQDFPFALWTSLPYWMWGLIPPCGGEAFVVRPELVLFSWSLCFPLSPGWDPCLREGGVLKLGGPGDLLAYLICRQRSELFPMSCSFRHLPLFSCSAQTQPWLQVPFVPHSWSQPRDFAAPLCLETHLRAHRALLDSPSVLGHEVWWRWSSCHQKPRLLLRHCVRKWWQWLLPVHQGSGWGQSNLCVPGPSLLGCDHPESTAQRDRVSGARASSQLGLRWAAGCLWETSSH